MNTKILRILILTALLPLCGCSLDSYRQDISRQFEQKRQESHRRISRTTDDANDITSPLILTGPVSMDKCVAVALANNSDIRTALAKFAESKGQITEALSTVLPKLTVLASAFEHDDEVDFNADRTYQWQLSARQPLYLGGQDKAAIDAAVVFDYRIKQQLRAAIQKVQLNVRKLYLDAVLAKNLVDVAVESKKNAEENLRLVKAKYQQGTSLKFELLRAQVRLRAVEAELINRKNDYVLAVTSLLNQIGISQFSQVAPGELLSYSPIEIAESECLRQAMMYRPELLTGQADIRLAEDNIVSERAANKPKVYLEANYQQDYPGFLSSFFATSKQWQRTSSASVVARWDIFDGFLYDGRLAKARALLTQQKISLEKTEQLVQLEVKGATLNLSSSREFVESQTGNVSDATEALRLARINFREGMGTSLDVINAELSAAAAQADYLRAVHSYQLARFSLHAAIGTIGESPLPTAGHISTLTD